MKKIIAFLIVAFAIFSCSSKKEGNMIVKGQIKGLKKGTLYLQKMKDTILVSVDSLTLMGNGNFLLTDNITSPVVYYLTLDDKVTQKRIMFFGEKGEITINDDLKKFGLHPEITGSENQKVYNNFLQLNKRFSNEYLDLIKKDLEAKRAKDQKLIQKLDIDYQNLIRKRYLFTTQFALNNKNSQVAPYIALTELTNANIKLLDTINNSLSNKVKNSLYGEKLQNFIDKIKAKKNR
ncbi:DUF4369 domain-containing protein [Tenacibaculum sp. UWU-22]|uniref:DUF4369 domain-containing protein n=1 Tax=Tenacibaculum sp. UWU-22 TaxID=3234187 RepID=UPI0034DB3288